MKMYQQNDEVEAIIRQFNHNPLTADYGASALVRKCGKVTGMVRMVFVMEYEYQKGGKFSVIYVDPFGKGNHQQIINRSTDAVQAYGTIIHTSDRYIPIVMHYETCRAQLLAKNRAMFAQLHGIINIAQVPIMNNESLQQCTLD